MGQKDKREQRIDYLPSIVREMQAQVFERDEYICQMCGALAGDRDPYDSRRKLHLTIRHITEKSQGGLDTPNNLRVICSTCNEGLQNRTTPLLPRPERIQLLTQVRRATIDDQLYVLEWLERKFQNARK
ncbi:MAG TPA: HNH endonuclease signature motif containing protein [Ktedonobacteraceae bacterium]|nr:HNH endonuclease signature motif containing protein [Ktedonobacteraceae bacterium]